MIEQELEGQCAIVTGGGTGIGAAIAEALADSGCRVVVCGRRRSPIKEVAAAIASRGGAALAVTADVSVPEDVERLVEETVANYGTVHILVNNAGISGGDYIHRSDPEEWDKIMSVNLRGPFLMARFVLPLMRAQAQGHILNISSESGVEHYPGDGAYGVSKHALNALGEYIQAENQELGIRVDTICPGMVVTPMVAGSPGLSEEKCLYPDDIAELAIWLLRRRPNVKIGRPVLIQTMENPWQ